MTRGGPLQYYVDQISPFTSSSGHWLTFLTVNQREYTMKDFASLSSLRNLASLRFHGAGHLDDRMIWKWTRYISDSEESYLQHLRLIEFIAHPNVTLESLQHLSIFPALVQVKFIPCHILPILARRAEEFGWRCQSGDAASTTDWIREYVEDNVEAAGDAKETGNPSIRTHRLRYTSLVANYARACWLSNGANTVAQASAQPILSLNMGSLSNSDSAWKNYDDQGMVFCRDVQSSNIPHFQQSARQFPRNLDTQRKSRLPSSRGRLLKAGKQSNLDVSLKGFMS